jgi:uncharacterized membrane protein
VVRPPSKPVSLLLGAALLLAPALSRAEPPEEWRDSPRAVKAKAWRDAGIGLLVVGVVVGAGATAIGLLDPCNATPDNDCRPTARRNAALGIGIPGAALFTAGIVSFSVGQARLARLRPAAAAYRRGFNLGIAVEF